ncbi:hypothetical protein F1880_008831 [Penicillium rolfsii]|nr:hypothetical protein F1880_008831 [Penicillium rolfsii]
MIEKSKLDACLNAFLFEISEIRDEKRHGLLEFEGYKGRNKNRLRDAADKLERNINSLLPGYLSSQNGPNLLEDEKVKKKLRHQLNRLGGEDSLAKSDFGKEFFHGAQKSFLDTTVARYSLQASDGGDMNELPSLSQGAFENACRHLTQIISGEKASATFACGGTVTISDNLPPGTHDVSPPIRLSWTAKDEPSERLIVLPINGADASGLEKIDQIVSDCDIASFGKKEKDVIDPSYRKAGKLDPSRFLSSFHPANLKILEEVEQLLVPNFNTWTGNKLPFRKLKAELYKLNVYSGPDGRFRKHVDTSQSKNQIGSLVVCLPSAFKGGKLIVRHQDIAVEFDWSARSGSTIQWAAFYSDCEHEINDVTDGHRITLTYNLYITDSGCGSVPRNVNLDPKTLPLYGCLSSLLAEPGFMKEGGILGVNCSHAYPHASSQARELLPRGLKGADLAVYSVFKSLGIDTHVLPVLRQKHDKLAEEEAVRDMLGYLRDGEEFEPMFSQLPQIIPVDNDLEKYWKMLYVSRRLHGTRKIIQFAQERNLEMEPGMFQDTKGNYFGIELHPYLVETRLFEGESITDIMNRIWPAQFIPGITWISDPLNKEMAFTYLAYGNEASIATVYSCATIIAAVPPFNQRPTMQGMRDV